MKISNYTISIFFLLISSILVSCMDARSYLSEEAKKDFYIFMVPSLSKVFVSSDLEVKTIKYCFYESECNNWKTTSNFKENKGKTKNIFELSNEDRFSKLQIESASNSEESTKPTQSNENSTSNVLITVDIANDNESNLQSEDNAVSAQALSDTTENKVVSKKRVVELVVPRPTGGSGGKTGKYEENYSNSQMTSTYKAVIPSFYSSKDPAGLIVYLHGDSANDYTNGWLFDPVAKYANKLNIIAVAVKATSSGDGYFRWYRKPKLHGDYIHDLIESKLFKDYNINKDRIYFTGASGGSQFITGMFVSRYSEDYGGGAIPVCGGADIYSDSVAGKTKKITDVLKKRFKIFYYTGQSDFLYSQTVNSKKSYADLGVKVGSETYPGTGHCDRSVLEGVKKGLAFFENN